jgi:hypothetical protein
MTLGYSAQRRWSATFDEPLHLYASRCAAAGVLDVNPEHPALVKRLVGWVAGSTTATQEARGAFSEGWQAALADFDRDGRAALARARTVILIHGALLLLAIWYLAYELCPTRPMANTASLIGLAACAFDPNLIAYATVVGYDIPAVAWLIAAMAAWVRPTHIRDMLGGACLGAAVASKHSALPPAVAMLAIVVLTSKTHWTSSCRRLGSMSLVALVCAVLLGGGWVYGDSLRSLLAGASHRPATTYILGTIHAQAPWYYFPLTVCFKLPLPLLVLAVAGILATYRTTGYWRSLAPLLTMATTYFIVAAWRSEGLGIRYILIIIPLFALFGVGLAGTSRRGFQLASLLVVWLAVETLCAWPDYHAHFNRWVLDAGHHGELLADSNLDWGQDLPALARWQQQHGEAPLYLAYFGTDRPTAYGVGCWQLPSFGRYALDGSRGGDDSAPATPRPSLLAISANLVLGLHAPVDYRQLAKHRPLATAGHSIWIYHLDDELLTLPVVAYWVGQDLPRLVRELSHTDDALLQRQLTALLTCDIARRPGAWEQLANLLRVAGRDRAARRVLANRQQAGVMELLLELSR